MIEGLLVQYVEVDEALVLEREGRLVALIYPSPDLLEEMNRRSGGQQNAGKARTHIEERLEAVRREVNGRLPGYSHISAVELQETEFVKTVSNKIKRAVYYPQDQEHPQDQENPQDR
ncbi:hypothetical protein [Alkalispirochaeta alkalica]|uniref:hypothetical protein n=1 Tax=Alkalispirochaeta alkalica TaxID=46356 RepID=UPI000364466C|nr:hypothetical protein [Alkalispirochaeta alkalica]